MKNLLLFTIAVYCCVLIAESNEEFKKWASEKMDEMLCKEKTNPDLFKKCVKILISPGAMKIAMEMTKINDADECIEAMCDEELHNKVCKEVTRQNEELDMNEEVINEFKECLGSSK